MQQISFTANYVKSVSIKRLNGKKYIADKANIVELTPKDDIPALKNIVRNWEDASYASNILQIFSDPSNFSKNYRTYALTKQSRNFNRLQDKDVLGIMLDLDQSEKRNQQVLGFLQVKPSNISLEYGKKEKPFLDNIIDSVFLKHKKPEHRHVGTAMVKTLMSLHPNDKTVLLPDRRAVGFWKQLGFEWNEHGVLAHGPIKKNKT